MTILYDSIKYLNSWYWCDDTWRIILQFCGALYNDFHLERNLNRLSNSANLREAIKETACEYLAVAGHQISEEKGKLGTSRSITKDEYINYYVNFEDPPLALFQSVWQEDCGWGFAPKSKRIFFFFDIEYYNNTTDIVPLIDQVGIFQAMEPVYRVISDSLNTLGINHLAVLTGRGYNFISSISCQSPIYEELIDIGGTLEPTLAAKQHFPAFKRKRPVPWKAEQSTKGIMRLVIFFIGLIIREARRRSTTLPVEISDKGKEGISFDPTFLTRGCSESIVGIPATPYIKLHFQKPWSYATEITPIPIRLIRSHNSHDNFPDVNKAISVRSNYHQSIEHFAGQQGYIPDGSYGLKNLIKLYRQSPMYYFHKTMDSVEHDPVNIWWRTYRDYDRISKSYPGIAHILRNPSPALLKPDVLDFMINYLLDKGWHPKHIAGLIRAIYEDWHFYWENRFAKHDAARWANGWVEILGGQRFFGM
jgi:hypothetical protein